jgi:hypothetical protein
MLHAWQKKFAAIEPAVATRLKPSALVNTRAVYCGDNLQQFAKLPNGCVNFVNCLP